MTHTCSSPSARQRGVTLPELLIALMIFAMISSVGVYALRLGVEGRAQLERTDERLRQWQIARAVIRDDLAHFTQRTTRDEFGVPSRGPFIGGGGFYDRRPVAGETPLAGFVRRGWDNPDAAKPRSELQYVEYLKVNDALVRRVRIYLDAAPATGSDADAASRDIILVDGLEEADMAFLAGQGATGFQWADDWPLTAAAPAPFAVRLTTKSADLGDIEHLFWIGRTGARVSTTG